MPAPPASASSAKPTRTSVTSTPRACAIPAQTPASARSSVFVVNLRSGIRSWYGARHLHLADPDVRLQHQHALAGLGDVTIDIAAVRRLAEHLHLPELRVAVDPQCDVVRNDDAQVSDIDARAHARLTCRKLHVAQVDLHLSDPELVARAEVLPVGDDVVAVTGAVAEVHVEDRGEHCGRDEEQRDECAERNRDALEHATHPPGVL